MEHHRKPPRFSIFFSSGEFRFQFLLETEALGHGASHFFNKAYRLMRLCWVDVHFSQILFTRFIAYVNKWETLIIERASNMDAIVGGRLTWQHKG